ncbi:nucleotidyl transferase AbiEii/AbiGii toxin family protein [Myceligenerans crystallogenes]|uniref:Nucleotidyl transferase AbiEii toxin, Type IV TA system n=1 Tax=Myceligenerans crystallogenes TaxID=316335 RepID=A0ABP4ZSA5_9MICO
MTTTKPYATPTAIWAAARDRARTAAHLYGRPAPELLRQFTFQRMLARVFTEPETPWVLKGGNALLARIQDARHSRDIDLLARIDAVDDALENFRNTISCDLGDHFAFAVTKVRQIGGTDQQAEVTGRNLTITPRIGSKKLDPFPVDLVTGSLMTSEPEILTARPLVELPGLDLPPFRLYPAVDHVADKLCATETVYRGRPSTQIRDLVDLVVIARTQGMGLSDLRSAIHQERVHRNLPATDTFQAPDGWAATYPAAAAATPLCDGLTFDDAVALVSHLLAPALTDTTDDASWNPISTTWDSAAVKGPSDMNTSDDAGDEFEGTDRSRQTGRCMQDASRSCPS